MGRIADWFLARIVPKADVAAGCSLTATCVDCQTNIGRTKYTQCCLNEGCQSWYGRCGEC